MNEDHIQCFTTTVVAKHNRRTVTPPASATPASMTAGQVDSDFICIAHIHYLQIHILLFPTITCVLAEVGAPVLSVWTVTVTYHARRSSTSLNSFH